MPELQVEDGRLQPDAYATDRRSSRTQKYTLMERRRTGGPYITHYAVPAAHAKTPKAGAGEIRVVESTTSY
jgi:hypothetical protein